MNQHLVISEKEKKKISKGSKILNRLKELTATTDTKETLKKFKPVKWKGLRLVQIDKLTNFKRLTLSTLLEERSIIISHLDS